MGTHQSTHTHTQVFVAQRVTVPWSAKNFTKPPPSHGPDSKVIPSSVRPVFDFRLVAGRHSRYNLRIRRVWRRVGSGLLPLSAPIAQAGYWPIPHNCSHPITTFGHASTTASWWASSAEAAVFAQRSPPLPPLARVALFAVLLLGFAHCRFSDALDVVFFH